MNIPKIMIILTLVLILAAGAALAGPPGGMNPHHGFHPMMGPASIAGDKENLYILAGPKIMQYRLADLKLLKTVDLPQPAPPPDKEAMPCPPPPLPMRGPQGLWAGGGSLYILAGPMLYHYSTPDLALKNKAELPKPELPKTGK